jgi:hypothetical protein
LNLFTPTQTPPKTVFLIISSQKDAVLLFFSQEIMHNCLIGVATPVVLKP